MSRRQTAMLLPLPLLFAGCVAAGGFPSLAPRPVEKMATGDVAEPGAPAAQADVGLMTRLSSLVESGEAAHRNFSTELATARPAIEQASGASPGGETWVAGQQAYSRLDVAHGVLLTTLADLDVLRREQVDSANPGNHAALDRASEQLSALDAEESAILAELAAKL